MPASRPVILCLVRYYLPGYKSGGPVRTIANMAEHLGDELDFSIVATDRDLNDEQPYSQVRVDQWNPVGKARVFYASPRSLSLTRLARLISATSHDVLYLNSFFDPVFTLRPLLARRLGLIPARPTVIAPRGEFSQGAFALRSSKKRAYMLLAGLAGLYRDLAWQASSTYEVEDIRAALGATAQRVEVAPDLLPLAAAPVTAQPRQQGPLRICFLSRITPKKNLDFLLRMLARVRSPVALQIFGPIEDAAYWSSCEALLRQLPANVSARYAGSVEHSRVGQVMRDHDLFFFPTHGENFGHVILEAMLAGCPVLISDRTPWRELERHGVGWDLPLASEQRFVEVIEHCSRLSAADYESLRLRVAAYASERLADRSVVDANLRLFRALATGSE